MIDLKMCVMIIVKEISLLLIVMDTKLESEKTKVEKKIHHSKRDHFYNLN